MTIDEIRRANLAVLVTELGGVGRLAETIGKDPSQVSQWLNASPDSRTGVARGMRAKTCRDIERKAGKGENWLDINHATESGAPWPFQRITPEQWAKIPDTVKGIIEGRALTEIDAWDKSEYQRKANAA
jgi:hypothetical protein